MPIPILMPALSPTMTEGTLAKWLVPEGSKVETGDIIAEIETDKATMEIESPEDGILGKLVVADGTEGVAVNATIAFVLEEGEDASALDNIAAGPAPSAPAPVGALPPAPAPAPPVAAPQAPAPVVAAAPAPDVQLSQPTGRILASPLARRMATMGGLDLSSIHGSGPRGRIVKADVETALGATQGGGGGALQTAAATASTPAFAPTPSAPITPDAPFTGIRNSQMRKIIARRLTESKQMVPHFYLTIDCDIGQLLKFRKELNVQGEKAGFKISVNDFVVRAAAFALKQVPAANASWTEAATLQYDRVDISIAVAVEGGLITPIIRDTNNKGLAQISNEMRDLAGRAKEGKLAPEEYQGGTFSISNLGMFGIKEFSAVINPPHGAILAVGAGEERAVARNGALAVATMMSCTLSCDHRVVDGAVGAEFLAAFKGFIESPMTMLL